MFFILLMINFILYLVGGIVLIKTNMWLGIAILLGAFLTTYLIYRHYRNRKRGECDPTYGMDCADCGDIVPAPKGFDCDCSP